MKAYEAISQILIDAKRFTEMNLLESSVGPLTTKMIDAFIEKRIGELGMKSYNKGYQPTWAPMPYPAVSCINVGPMIAHGIPSDTVVIGSGDIISIDAGIIDPEGNCGDAAISFGLGELENKNERLLRYAKQLTYHVINQLVPGAHTRDIARSAERFALDRGFRINRRFAGHAIGKEMHQKPNIYTTDEEQHDYAVIEEGQVFCIEPMITYGKDNWGFQSPDGWTVFTQDGAFSTFFEHMVEVTKDGPKVLTTHFAPDVF
jgi:methionyl aminopeptidase